MKIKANYNIVEKLKLEKKLNELLEARKWDELATFSDRELNKDISKWTLTIELYGAELESLPDFIKNRFKVIVKKEEREDEDIDIDDEDDDQGDPDKTECDN